MTASKRLGSHKDRILAGKYRLDELLGTGGMGEVYRAVRIADGALFAVKILRIEHCADSGLVARFLREARAADLVRHPNVVRILETGTDDAGTPFFVQELLRGEDLALCLKSCGGRLTPDIAIDLLLPIVEAMGIAHASGVVHRDLKPGNVYLARINGDTMPKLLDFGISSLAASTEISRITSTGTSLGTPAYMSPEQVMGQSDVDARSDVWSLGVMLYELIAGCLPFVMGESPGALFVQICTRNPRALEVVVPDVPRDLAQVIARCLRRNRGERYSTATELAEDLRCVRDGKPIAPSSLPEQRAIAADVEMAARATLGRGASNISSEDMATVATPAADAAEARRSARFSTASHGSMREIDLDVPSSDSANTLKLASIPPVSGAWRPGAHAATRPVRAPEPTTPTGSAAPFFAVAAIVAGAATLASPWRAGWPLLSVVESATSFAPRAGMTVLAIAALAGGAFAAVRGVRRAPIAIGLLVIAIGAVGVAIALGVDALMPGQLLDLAPRVTPWAAALVPFGTGLHGADHARRLWWSGNKGVAAVLVAAAVVALAIAAHVARAAIG